MPAPKRNRDLMPNFFNPKPDEPEEFDKLNQRLNILQGVNVMSGNEGKRRGSRKSKSNTNYQTAMRRQSNVKSVGGRIESEVGYNLPKRPRVEAPITLNIPYPWDNSSRLPGLQPYPNSTLPANVIAKQKVPVPTTQRSPEEVSSYVRRCLDTSTMPVSSNCVVDAACETIIGRSDLTKKDAMNNSPLDNMPAQSLSTRKGRPSAKQNATKVYSFEDLMVTKTQTEEIGVDVVEPMKCDDGSKCEVNAQEKRNKRNVSLVERFKDEEINLHIMSLKEGSSQSGIREMSDANEDLCQLCGGGRVLFPPPPIYCSFCTTRIKDTASYYTIGEELGDAQYQLCSTCYNRSKRKFTVYGIDITKDQMLKMNNTDNQIAEEWVQCESCEGWQHQICGLYNKDKDTDNTADYICPKCLLEERQSNNNSGFDDNTDLAAKDLPETILSYFIEQRLFRRLREERSQTAEATGKSVDEVLEPEDLTLRVVYSADKTSIVTKKLADWLHKENYPSEFPYRSKVILLFQKVEGVDICIFAFFVQEFGSECSQPNQRSTYIVYLDSVKYFRPERVTFSGEALRTFVYHEILIGYLEYCKLRGFTTSYIWACPPRIGEDYIMYSHPKSQKTPQIKKLRQWYVSMLDKAVQQRAVANVTNLHERFFAVKEKSTCYMTAARLPYFEGSFWSCKAEELIQEFEREDDNELAKKVKKLSRKKLKGLSYDSNGCVDIDDAKNVLLMEKLEEKVSQNKENFMVVELNYSCTRCSKAILSGLRWFCKKCKNLQLCESCYDAEQELPGEHIHTMKDKEKHQLSKVQVRGISSTTEDNDIIQENDMLENRQAFLDFSQKHNYNFDMLRRAKYSSMMILHHLHTSNKHSCSQNSSRLTCGVCNKDVSKTIYFPCLICSIFRLCTGCYAKSTMNLHLHLFPTFPTANGAQPRTVMVLEILNALSHAHQCQPTATKLSCSYPKCNEVKVLFYHNAQCRTKEKGACCKICNKLGMIIRIHANHCEDLECPVQRCREMKEYVLRKILDDKGVQG